MKLLWKKCGKINYAFGRACSADEARQIEAVFAPQAARFQGGQRALAQALEAVRLCTAWREASSR